MRFEFDPKKSLANKEKHGIDFVEAQQMWRSPVLMIPARSTAEPRRLVIGRIGSKHWTAIVTERGESIRIVSVRRSRENEKAHYKENT